MSSPSRAKPAPSIVRPAGDTIGYVRVSTDQQTGEHRTSLAEQQRAISERAHQMSRTIPPTLVFEDPGASGATAERRPGFMEMVAYCEAHPRTRAPGVVLVLNDSRFGRFDDPEEATHWRFVLKKLGWIVRFAEGDDMEDGIGRKVIRLIGSAQASEYRANLKRTARRATRATAAQGRWQNRAPMGFRRLAIRPDGTKRVLEATIRKADNEIVVLTYGPDEEVEIIRYCFAAYMTAGISQLGLARELLVRWPGRQWSQNTVNALLKNPAYVGDVVWCRRPHDPGERAERWIRPKEEWVVVRDAHPSIVSRDLFEQVQQKLLLNKKATRATSGGYPLSGLIRCAVCGDRFVGGGGRIGPAHDPYRFRKYQEVGASRPLYAVKCPGRIPTLNRRWLEARVIDAIAGVVDDPGIRAMIEQELDRALAVAMGDRTVDHEALKREKERLVLQRKRLVDAIAANIVTEREAAQSATEIRARIEAIDLELSQTQFAKRRIAGTSEYRDRVLKVATDFRQVASRASGLQLRELVRPWLADAVFDKRTYVLTLSIRRVPNIIEQPDGVLAVSCPPARDAQHQHSPRDLIVRRRIKVPRRGAA